MSDWPRQPPIEPPTSPPAGLWAPPSASAPLPEMPPPPGAPEAPGGGGFLWVGVVVAVVVALVVGTGLVFFVDTDEGDDGRAADSNEEVDSSTSEKDSAPEESSSDDSDDEPADEADESDQSDEPDPGVPPTVAEADLPDVSSNLDNEAFDEQLAQLAAWVEDARGLEFIDPVVVEVESDDTFEERLLSDFDEDVEDLEMLDRLYTSLGLIDEEADLVGSFSDLLGAGVLGFYDPETRELVVRGESLTPYTQLTVVHELVHALDDQHFGLERSELEDVDDESGYAFSAVVEGNARRLENEWRDQQSREDREAITAEEMSFAADVDIDIFSFPFILIDLISSPYEDGEPFVEAVMQAEGPSAVDQLLESPPTTSESILHPEIYLDGETLVEMVPPQADGEVIDEGAFGELFLTLLLAEELPGFDARDAAEGWGSDWYVAWDDGDELCMRVHFAMDTRADLDELEDALAVWASAQPDASVHSDDDLLELNLCG